MPDNMSRSLLISNFLLFQLGWFACVLGAANQQVLPGSLVAALIIIIHLWHAERFLPELRLIIIAMSIGLVFESLLVFMGVSQYSAGVLWEGFAPYWMIIIWALFASTINVSMSWVKQLSLPLLALIGAVLAPLSYLAGSRLQAVVFPDTTVAVIWLALGWAILFPLLVFVARYHNGYSSGEAAPEHNQRRKCTDV